MCFWRNDSPKLDNIRFKNFLDRLLIEEYGRSVPMIAPEKLGVLEIILGESKPDVRFRFHYERIIADDGLLRFSRRLLRTVLGYGSP